MVHNGRYLTALGKEGCLYTLSELRLTTEVTRNVSWLLETCLDPLCSEGIRSEIHQERFSPSN